MFSLLRSKIIPILWLVFVPFLVHGQWNLANHDLKKFYFGITLSYNQAEFHLNHSAYFLQQDTVLVAEPLITSGFGLGLIGTMRLNKRFSLRINPSLIFAEKNIRYVLNQDSSQTQANQNIESVLTSLPIQIKFESDRIKNFKVYAIGGLKMDYDLSENSRAKKGNQLILIHALDFGYEGGVGFQFYFPSFIFSPEIKISNGLGNLLVGNKGYIYSHVLDKLTSRMIIFSIHLEG